MFDLTLHTIVLRLASLLLIAGVHGFVACAIARLLGDSGPAQDGRLTLSPLPHLDALGSVALVAFGAGWTKPLALDPARLRPNALPGALAVVAVASLAILGVAAFLALALPWIATALSDSAAPLAMGFVVVCVRLSVAFALLNLVPLPPLAGGYLLDALWPAAAQAMRRHQALIGVALIAALATGMATPLLAPPVEIVTRAILGDIASAASWR